MFEYKDEKAYTKGQEVLGKLIAGNKSFFDKINLKRTASRSINLMDFDNFFLTLGCAKISSLDHNFPSRIL